MFPWVLDQNKNKGFFATTPYDQTFMSVAE